MHWRTVVIEPAVIREKRALSGMQCVITEWLMSTNQPSCAKINKRFLEYIRVCSVLLLCYYLPLALTLARGDMPAFERAVTGTCRQKARLSTIGYDEPFPEGRKKVKHYSR